MPGSQSHQKYSFNRLLAALPPSAYASLKPQLEIVSLDFRQTIYEPKQQITYVYFPLDSLISLFTVMGSTAAEVGMVGNEGMVGLAVFLKSNTTPFKAIVQIPGEAMRMKADVFKQAVNQISSLSSLLHRYTFTLIIQIAQSAACNSYHTVEQRCCRWLLTMHDSAKADQFLITQDFLSQMLGVRRASVTEVAGKLQKAGLISYSRGQMQIIDRRGLETSACECYALVKSEFNRLFG
jgi:CRP-like cAMP-binding protein